MKKITALAVGLLVLGFAFTAAQEKAQTQEQAQVKTQSQEKAQVKTQTQEKAQVKSQTQEQAKVMAQTQEKAQVKTQTKAQTKTAVKTQTKSEFRHQYRIPFIDENGDGINDLAKDADGDGIPNGQDPDWVRPQDGTGYQEKHKNGQSDEAGMAKGQKAGQAAKPSLSKGSFRSGMQGAGRTTGTGVCDGTGPKGTAQRKGRR